MSQKVKVGLIGTGVGLRYVLPSLLRTGKVELVGVCGSSKERAEELSSEFNPGFVTGDFKEICDADVDLICVTTPNEFHEEHMAYALQTDKNVYLEKPIGNDENQTREIAKHSKHGARIEIVGHQLRFNPYFQKIKEMISSGDLGRVYFAEVHQSAATFIDPSQSWSWSLDPERGGGMRLALGVHLVDLSRYLFASEPSEVIATQDPVFKVRNPENAGERECKVSIHFDSTLVFDDMAVGLTLNLAAHTPLAFDILVRGEKADLTFDYKNKLVIHRKGTLSEKVLPATVDDEDSKREGKNIFQTSLTYYADEIVDSILDGKKEVAGASTLQDAILNMRVLDKALESAKHLQGSAY